MITYSLITNIGSRQINEDAVGVSQNNGNLCFILCDGLGGHGMGDVASALVKDEFLSAFAEEPNPDASFISKSFVNAQKKTLKKAKRTRCKKQNENHNSLYDLQRQESVCRLYWGFQILRFF